MQKPQFTIVDFVSGKFSDELEQYLTDQVPLRDDWVTLKIYLELAVGKRESGGVYIGRDKYLMDKFTSYSKKQLAANAAALAELQKKLAAEDISMDTILVPVAAQVRAMFPVFAGISGSYNTTFSFAMSVSIREETPSSLFLMISCEDL